MSAIDELKEYSNELLYRIKLGIDYYRAWNELNIAIRTHSEVIHIANDFFSVVHESLLNSMMSEIIKLYDEHPNCRSVVKLNRCCMDTNDINKYLKSCPQKLDQYLAIRNTFDAYLKKKETIQIIANLKMRRDKYYMHSDKHYFGEIQRLVDTAPFSFDEAEELFREAFNFCYVIYELLSDSKWQPGIHQTCLVHKRDFSGLNKLLDMCQQYNTEP